MMVVRFQRKYASSRGDLHEAICCQSNLEFSDLKHVCQTVYLMSQGAGHIAIPQVEKSSD